MGIAPGGEFPDQLSIFEKMANSDSKRKKFGSAEIYDGAIIPTTQSYNRVPGSRGSNQPKGKGKAKGTVVSRYNRWVNWAETGESNLSEETYQFSGQEGKGEYFQPDENLSLEVRQARGDSESESDLDWGEIDKYGTESEVGNFVLNHEQTGDYGELENAIGVEAFKAFGKEQMSRKFQGKSERTFKDFSDKLKTPRGGR